MSQRVYFMFWRSYDIFKAKKKKKPVTALRLHCFLSLFMNVLFFAPLPPPLPTLLVPLSIFFPPIPFTILSSFLLSVTYFSVTFCSLFASLFPFSFVSLICVLSRTSPQLYCPIIFFLLENPSFCPCFCTLCPFCYQRENYCQNWGTI